MTDCRPIHKSVRRCAVLTCVVALLPISIGALVTTLKAGMAFADWPTSDGQNMLLYPWLNDLRHTDKFVEHGHRLAGVLIGLVSIGLVTVTFAVKEQKWVKSGAVAILIAVIAQGLLGGMRVRMDEQVLAMTHSITGGLFFTLTFLFALAVNRTAATTAKHSSKAVLGPATAAMVMVLPLAILGQYVLGGFFRHLNRMLHEHVGGAVIVGFLTAFVVTALLRTELPIVRRRARWLLLAVLIQVGLGLGAWVTRMGLPSLGWVATVNSMPQNIICSLHTVGGMFLLATSSAAASEIAVQIRLGRLQLQSSGHGQSLSSTGGIS